MKLVRYADRRDLLERRDLSAQTFPEADWEAWTGMRFPEDGTYVFAGALAPLEVRAGVGRHVEPNVWVRHRL